MTPEKKILDAIDAGDAEGVRALLAAGANVKVADEDGVTLVMRAAAAGNAETVRLLLAAGADPTARDRHGQETRNGTACIRQAEAVQVDPAAAHGRIGSLRFTVRGLQLRVRSLRFAVTLLITAPLLSGFMESTQPPRVRIVAMGDSTTAGTPAFKSPRETPPNGQGDETGQYAYWLMKAHPDWEVINQGVNAQRSDVIAARFDEDVIAKKPAVVVIIAGVNDIYQGQPAQHVKDQLAAMYTRAHDINAWIRAQGRADPGVIYVDTRAAVAAPGDPDKLASSPDGLHPDAAGYRKMADAIRPAVEQALRSKPVQ